MAVLTSAIFGMTSLCPAQSENEIEDTALVYDSGIPTDLSITSPLGNTAEAVRFTPPTSPWTLTEVQIAGWNGFDNKTLPAEKIVYLEIRDKDLNLLYQFADSHIPYFTHTTIILADMKVTPITINDDFYVFFYGRGAVGVAYNSTVIDDGRSYFYNRITGELFPARAEVEGSEELVPLNWIIRAVGH